MAEAEQHLARATTAGRLGPYQLMAAVQSVHALRAVTGTTDTRAVAQLYEGLAHLTPTVGVLVARAAAVLADARPARALALLEELDGRRGRRQGRRDRRVPAVLGHPGRRADALADPAADEARARALRLTSDPAVAAHLARRGDVAPR